MIHNSLSQLPLSASEIRTTADLDAACGGIALFEGIIRDRNHGQNVSYLVYECYEKLALKEMRRIAQEASERYDLRHATTAHRFGRLEIGETAVVILAASKHRDEAFAGCRYMIDQLKIRVPIWKQEFYTDGQSTWTRCEH